VNVLIAPPDFVTRADAVSKKTPGYFDRDVVVVGINRL
jgi:hypothetical protein